MSDEHIEFPSHIKEKILLFFLKTSVPRILAKKEKEEEVQAK